MTALHLFDGFCQNSSLEFSKTFGSTLETIRTKRTSTKNLIQDYSWSVQMLKCLFINIPLEKIMNICGDPLFDSKTKAILKNICKRTLLTQMKKFLKKLVEYIVWANTISRVCNYGLTRFQDNCSRGKLPHGQLLPRKIAPRKIAPSP